MKAKYGRQCRTESAIEEKHDGGVDDGKKVLANSDMPLSHINEPNGKLVGEKKSNGCNRLEEKEDVLKLSADWPMPPQLWTKDGDSEGNSTKLLLCSVGQ